MSDRRLILEVAVPDFYLDDVTPDTLDEALRIADPNITFDLLVEGEKGAALVDVKGVIVGARIEAAAPSAEQQEGER